MIDATVKIPMLAKMQGLFIALVIMIGWLAHLGLLLSLNLSITPLWAILGAILVQTFLNTGLFITAHDSIHGSVCPHNQRINDSLGRLCAIAYAGLPYCELAQNHRLHHLYPASADDPDFHYWELKSMQSSHFIPWYQHFMGQYLSWPQFLQMASVILLISVSLGLSPLNVILLWGLPLFLSSLQLFYFGTYQPHHTPKRGRLTSANQSHAKPWWLSLLACYHFGYHQEHHDYPHVPWWKLPETYQEAHQQFMV